MGRFSINCSCKPALAYNTGALASQNAKFFFLGCYREGETDNFNPLWKTLCNNDLVKARSTDVKLDCMDEETLTTMVSETLCLSPRLTRSLSSIIYHKTRGNPLFVSQLMISLGKEEGVPLCLVVYYTRQRPSETR